MYITEVINFDSDEYWKSVRLREIELRLPLGLRFLLEDLKKEETEEIFILRDELDNVLSSCQFILDGQKAKMRQVATKKSLQGKGLGKELYLFAESKLKQKGFSEIYCHARMTAIDFYLRLGFKIYSEKFAEVGISHVKMRKKI